MQIETLGSVPPAAGPDCHAYSDMSTSELELDPTMSPDDPGMDFLEELYQVISREVWHTAAFCSRNHRRNHVSCLAHTLLLITVQKHDGQQLCRMLPREQLHRRPASPAPHRVQHLAGAAKVARSSQRFHHSCCSRHCSSTLR